MFLFAGIAFLIYYKMKKKQGQTPETGATE
jgi:hypothetical protein